MTVGGSCAEWHSGVNNAQKKKSDRRKATVAKDKAVATGSDSNLPPQKEGGMKAPSHSKTSVPTSYTIGIRETPAERERVKRGTNAVRIIYIVVVIRARRLQLVWIVVIIVIAGAQPRTIKTRKLSSFAYNYIAKFGKNQVKREAVGKFPIKSK